MPPAFTPQQRQELEPKLLDAVGPRGDRIQHEDVQNAVIQSYDVARHLANAEAAAEAMGNLTAQAIGGTIPSPTIGGMISLDTMRGSLDRTIETTPPPFGVPDDFFGKWKQGFRRDLPSRLIDAAAREQAGIPHKVTGWELGREPAPVPHLPAL